MRSSWLPFLTVASPLFLAFQMCSIRAQTAANCHDPIGIPCSTIVYMGTQWQIGNAASGLIAHNTHQETIAHRSDGSLVIMNNRGYTSLYSAVCNQVIRIDETRKTISHRPPIIWHDRPFRRSKDGDDRCAMGILHFGTDFHLSGDAAVAGIHAKVWERGDGWFWHEEEYLAPSLDCAVLKSYTIRRNRIMVPTFINSLEAVSVRVGEPDRALFTVPAGYQEIKDPGEDALRQFVARNTARH